MRKVNSMLVITGMLFLSKLAFGVLPEYEIIDLGTLGGSSSYPLGINDTGQVVGKSQTVDRLTRGFLCTHWRSSVRDRGNLESTPDLA